MHPLLNLSIKDECFSYLMYWIDLEKWIEWLISTRVSDKNNSNGPCGCSASKGSHGSFFWNFQWCLILGSSKDNAQGCTPSWGAHILSQQVKVATAEAGNGRGLGGWKGVILEWRESDWVSGQALQGCGTSFYQLGQSLIPHLVTAWRYTRFVGSVPGILLKQIQVAPLKWMGHF